MSAYPTGTVTFLFTDIESSTKLWQEYPQQMKVNLARHDDLLRQSIERNEGYVFKTVGDAFCAAFPTAWQGVKAAIESQQALTQENWGGAVIKVRMGLHTGDAEERDNDYFGHTLNRVARLMSAGHGGQTLISAATQELMRDKLPKGVTLADLGESRLKDLIRSEHIYQLNVEDLPSEFPPIKTLEKYRHNLPVQMTSFIGREKEIAEVQQALSEHHLVTLTGSGGAGKTRLSLQVAADLLDQFPNGTWFVELAPITDPDLIPQTILSAADMQTQPGRSALESLTDFLEEKKSLLVLDNCEHLIEVCAKLAETLLTAAPNLKILASSREALGVKGEQAWHVPSLSIPDLKNLPPIEGLSQYEAVRLFIDRALLVQPHFAVTNENAPAVAQICSRLDGIPLAIELAAARLRMLSPEQISARLDGRFRLLTGGSRTALPRQQTLRALIDWSYDLLSDSEKLLLRRLAVFMGGWTLELAEQVCSDEKIDSYEVLDILGKLVDKSLVAAAQEKSGTRYRILETVRQYAREKLFESGEGEALRNRHTQAVLELTEKAEPEIRGADQLLWLDRVEAEYENVRAALEWSREQNPDIHLRLVSSLWRFWDLRSYSIEARDWFEQALALTQGQYNVTRARALSRASMFFRNLNDPQKARPFAEQAMILSRDLNEKSSLAMALSTLGELTLSQPETAQKFLDESIRICDEIGDHWIACIVWLNRGMLANRQNNPDSQKLYIEKGIQEARLSKDNRRISRALADMAFLLMDQGKYMESRNLFSEGLVLSRQIGDLNTNERLMDIAIVDMYLEDYPQAESLFVEALAVFESGGDNLYQTITIMNLAFLAWIKNDTARFIELLQDAHKIKQENQENSVIEGITFYLGRVALLNRDPALARDQFSKSLKGYQKLDDKLGCADCIAGFGMLALSEGQLMRSAKLFGAYQKLASSLPPLYPFVVRKISEQITMTKEQLGGEAFEGALNQGKEMTLEQAIAYALEEI